MNVQQSLVLGIIQGLTEFLPVSSTAHLILMPKLFSTALEPRADIRLTYDVVIQSGTLLSVLVYFWRDWLKMLGGFFKLLGRRRGEATPEQRMLGYLAIGTVPAGLIGLTLEKRLEELAQPEAHQEAYLVIGGALIVVGIVMWVAESLSRRNRELEHVRWVDALIIGFAQALAVIPGVSRSGSTITAGLIVGLSRDAAARFSFLLMTPVMLAATGYKFLKVVRGATPMYPDEFNGMLLATAVAAVTGFIAIWGLLRWLRQRPLWIFSIYRIALGAFVIGFYFQQSR